MTQDPTPQNSPEEQPSPTFVSNEPIHVGRHRYLFGGLIGCLVSLALAVAVLILTGTGLLDRVTNALGQAVNPPTTARTMTTETILTGIQPLGQLVSISVQLAKADIDVGVQQGGLNACGFSASHVAEGTVEAGIDLSRISAEDISYDAASETYTLHLPAPALTSCRIDFIRQYSRSTTVCNVDWDQARLLANYTAINDFRDDSLESGLLDRGEQEARLVLGNFVGALTGSHVNFVFDQSDAPLPPSCAPQTPSGWSYDEATGSWINR